MKWLLSALAIVLFYVGVAQLVERPIETRQVDSSNLSPDTKNPLNQTEPTPERGFSVKPIITNGIAVNLTDNLVQLWKAGQLVDILPLAYQSKEGVWFQTPTGYYSVGEKRANKVSSLVEVKMPYAIQIYEDFYLHEIPIDKTGQKLTSEFTGGCLRFDTESAKKIFEFAERGMPIVIYQTTEKLKMKEGFAEPVDLKNYWIRQRFNNPIRHFWENGGDINNLHKDYYQHAGVDLAPYEGSDLSVYAIADGEVLQVINNKFDHGLGNTIIIDHGEFYALYAHLAKIQVGSLVKAGQRIGEVGNTGNGCDYWRIGQDGCDSKNPPDTHLHLEIKQAPVLENPIGEMACRTKEKQPRPCYGYTPDNPKSYGYYDPLKTIFEVK